MQVSNQSSGDRVPRGERGRSLQSLFLLLNECQDIFNMALDFSFGNRHGHLAFFLPFRLLKGLSSFVRARSLIGEVGLNELVITPLIL